MSTLRTSGELRSFLADVLVGVRDGSIDSNKANAIAKVAAQINQSLTTEVSTALQMEKMGAGRALTGSMAIGADINPPSPVELEADQAPEPDPAPERSAVAVIQTTRRSDEKIWCEQCEGRVTVGQAVSCKSPHCKAKIAA